MWGVCNTPLPYRQERGHKSRKEWTDIAPIHGSLRPLIITSNHYGNSVIRTEVGAYCIRPLKRPQRTYDQEAGHMWGVCNTPLPYRQERGTQKQKIPPRGWTDIDPFIITSNHYGNSVVRMYREVGAYCIRPIERLAKGV